MQQQFHSTEATMKNVLVTGGAGFIGSALSRKLLDLPQVKKVVVIDNLSSGHKHNLDNLGARLEFHHADVRDLPTLESLFDGIDVVFHQAAIPSVPLSIDQPELTHCANVDGTFNVLLAAHRRRVSRVVYAASSSAYGDTETVPSSEADVPRPKSPYAVQKLAGEYYARTFSDCYGLDTVSLRYFNVFGPRQDPSSTYSGVISLFCNAVINRRAPVIFGDGEQTRDFTYVENIVALNILAALSPRSPGQIYNGGTGYRVTLNELWRALTKIEQIELSPHYASAREGDVKHSQADVTAARRDLGYEPRVGLTEGLARTIEWYRHSIDKRVYALSA
jgi:nucleoside-diphosphate-sugar epimerase